MPYLAVEMLSSIGVLIAYRLAEQIAKHQGRRIKMMNIKENLFVVGKKIIILTIK